MPKGRPSENASIEAFSQPVAADARSDYPPFTDQRREARGPFPLFAVYHVRRENDITLRIPMRIAVLSSYHDSQPVK